MDTRIKEQKDERTKVQKEKQSKGKRDKLIYSKNAFKIVFLKMSREEKKEKVENCCKTSREQVSSELRANRE